MAPSKQRVSKSSAVPSTASSTAPVPPSVPSPTSRAESYLHVSHHGGDLLFQYGSNRVRLQSLDLHFSLSASSKDVRDFLSELDKLSHRPQGHQRTASTYLHFCNGGLTLRAISRRMVSVELSCEYGDAKFHAPIDGTLEAFVRKVKDEFVAAFEEGSPYTDDEETDYDSNLDNGDAVASAMARL